jgi:hypothetical protein
MFVLNRASTGWIAACLLLGTLSQQPGRAQPTVVELIGPPEGARVQMPVTLSWRAIRHYPGGVFYRVMWRTPSTPAGQENYKDTSGTTYTLNLEGLARDPRRSVRVEWHVFAMSNSPRVEVFESAVRTMEVGRRER